MPDAAPLVVFSDDWGRHPSSCQHLIRELLPRRRVTWVNTIGTRPPRLDRATFRRGFEKLRSWFACPRLSHPEAGQVRSPDLLDPFMLPSFRSRFARRMNRWLIAHTVRSATESGPAPIIVTTLPVVADLVGRIRAARWVYYCVDDYSVWPGLDGRTLRAMEAELVARVDVAIAVSEALQSHLAKLGKPAQLLTHGVDLDFWRNPRFAEVASIRGWPIGSGPLIVFWGVIDRRMDTGFVRQLADTLDRGPILLVGPLDNPDPELLRIPRVQALPPMPFADLPALAGRAAVLIAPYADLPVTRAMQPLKLKEYLATSRPVVVRKLPSTEAWSDCCDVVETPEAFAAAVRERLRTGLPDDQRRARERLASEGWSAKAELFERWLDGA